MPNLYISGDKVETGSHGEHDYFYASGEPVLDAGLSTYVFESGTGVGGGSLIVGGTSIGFFESNETHADWYGTSVDDGNARNNQLIEKGVLDQSGSDIVYLFGHYDTGNDSYAIGGSFYGESTQGDIESTDGYRFDVTWNELGSLATSPDAPQVQDDPENNTESDSADDETYGTNGNGDPVAKHVWGWGAGDGHLYEITLGSYTGDVTFTELSDDRLGKSFVGDVSPEYIRGRGPLNNVNLSWDGFGTTVSVAVNL